MEEQKETKLDHDVKLELMEYALELTKAQVNASGNNADQLFKDNYHAVLTIYEE